MDYETWSTEQLKEKFSEYRTNTDYWQNAVNEVRDELIRRNFTAIKAQLEGKDEPYGAVTVNGLKFNQPKNVYWDQRELGRLAASIEAAGESLADYMTITYKVPEGAYKGWPEPIRNAFMTARTVKPGQISVEV